jgi:hypothetical protein
MANTSQVRTGGARSDVRRAAEDLRRRVEQLALIAKAAATGTELGRRISELQTLEASTRAAAHSAAARIEEKVLDLDTRCKIAEQAVAAELSEDKGAFVRALMRELQSWTCSSSACR